MLENAKVKGRYSWRVFDVDGVTELRRGEFPNGITNAGLNHLLSTQLGAGTQVTAWKMGLIDDAAFSALAPTDTMSSHAGWVENEDYAEATRGSVVFGAASGQVIASSSSVTFTANASVTIAGAFLVSNSTKGGSTGTLFSTGEFASPQALASGQILRVDYECSAASA